MRTYCCIIGRSPELAIEELVIVMKQIGHIVEVTGTAVVIRADIEPTRLLSQLGGTVKIAQVVLTMPHWREVSRDTWLQVLRPELNNLSGKFQYGYSVYGAGSDAKKHLYATGLSLKKHLRASGISARLVSSREDSLSSVVVTKNNLLNREVVLVQGATTSYICATRAVQDFDSYGLRDYGRPERNMERGLLPPKLAQIMLNVAHVTADSRVLDPFCGGGTIIQEALLKGLRHVWGSDKDASALHETEANITWLSQRFKIPNAHLMKADALMLKTAYPDHMFDAIVTEPFLGPARLLRQKRLIRQDIERIVSDVTALYNQFFVSMAGVTKPGAQAVIVFPIFKVLGSEYTIGDLRRLGNAGWELQNPEVVAHLPSPRLSPRGQLLYSRDDQVVMREITRWIRR